MKDETKLAIMLFGKIAEYEYKLEEAKFELGDTVIPKSEGDIFIKETERIEDKYAKKLKALKKKFGVY